MSAAGEWLIRNATKGAESPVFREIDDGSDWHVMSITVSGKPLPPDAVARVLGPME